MVVEYWIDIDIGADHENDFYFLFALFVEEWEYLCGAL